MINPKSKSLLGWPPFFPNCNWPAILPPLPLIFPHGNFKITIAYPHFELTPLQFGPNPSPTHFPPRHFSNHNCPFTCRIEPSPICPNPSPTHFPPCQFLNHN
ncbi:uncharacterized protein Gasu_65600 [Galdieria sulphuraria]|uniref:Uncharacterized protein n=1 Tax=Galdieria sulphuraria TaxID=130081 RepID=M2XQS1_GALSU|nr:uncharacterized protein Gasu_65600 [Galdieria sulphuraria]EME25779.1 hypothetical protein Gasu_65600 [Galdieria sulphuraria]|eukprot:XP_005702299.1 hypothetical protein Gasu_65600 [Galdieria sulphuraria]